MTCLKKRHLLSVIFYATVKTRIYSAPAKQRINRNGLSEPSFLLSYVVLYENNFNFRRKYLCVVMKAYDKDTV